MAGLRFSFLKSLRNCTNLSSKPQFFHWCSYYVKSVNYTNGIGVRPSYACVNRNGLTKETKSYGNSANTHSKVAVFESLSRPTSGFSPTLSNKLFGRTVPLISVSPLSKYCSYSTSYGSNSGKGNDQGVSATSGADVPDTSVVGNDWVVNAQELWHNAVDAATFTGQKAKEASAELSSHVQQLLNSHPYLNDVVVPVSCTLTGAILAWVVMPRILRRFHKYAMQGSSVLLSGSMYEEELPYEKSFWGALEDPVRYQLTFMAFAQIAVMVAPNTFASQYLPQACRGAIIISFVWFLHRWKTNVLARALGGPSVVGLDRDKLLALDKISSVGLFVIGIMAFAEACGVAVQSILTVGGIGGVATAFAARDVLGNVLSGLSMQFSKPFSLGDTIKAGSIEGQVVEMGLTTTSLLNAEKFPVIVPNSLFSSQVIVNKSRAEWRAIITKIPLQINDFDKVPEISNAVVSMLRSHAKVFLGKEAPYCFLSRIESSFAELTLGCNLKQMRKDELYLTEQEILLRSVQIIKQHGGMLGRTYQDSTIQ
ncbi:hypothetical protein UlMin_022514 [Ulmus minor]